MPAFLQSCPPKGHANWSIAFLILFSLSIIGTFFLVPWNFPENLGFKSTVGGYKALENFILYFWVQAFNIDSFLTFFILTGGVLSLEEMNTNCFFMNTG